nr:hypothetical protein [Ruegeria intermedia]
MKLPKPDLSSGTWSLSRAYLAASVVVMGTGAIVIGGWVTGRIEDAVVQNSANSAALYMESILSPLSQELAYGDSLSDPAARAVSELFDQQSMQERIVSYKIWKKGGLIAHASDPDIIGRTFPPTDDLKRAWSGQISGSFEELDRAENQAEAAMGLPLLEAYSPIREIWSGEIIAVGEFYQRADQLQTDLMQARRTSWLVVATTFGLSTLILYLIVAVGDRTIRTQSDLLKARLAESQKMSQQNADLRARVIEASDRSTAQTDRFLRKLGAELHDGPAQYLALAALRLDSAFPPGRVRRQGRPRGSPIDSTRTERDPRPVPRAGRPRHRGAGPRRRNRARRQRPVGSRHARPRAVDQRRRDARVVLRRKAVRFQVRAGGPVECGPSRQGGEMHRDLRIKSRRAVGDGRRRWAGVRSVRCHQAGHRGRSGPFGAA